MLSGQIASPQGPLAPFRGHKVPKAGESQYCTDRPCEARCGMANRVLTKSDHTAMLEAFRADAPHYRPARVAKTCQIDPKTAHKAWSPGWPNRGWRPIVEILEAERQKARAILFEQRAAQITAEQDDRDAASQDAAQQTANEAQMVRTAQTVAHDGLGAIAAISTQARALGELVKDRLEADCQRDEDDPYRLSGAQGLSLLDKLAKVTKTLLENGRQAMEMERLRLHRPIGGDQSEELREMTVDEADTRIESCQHALEQAKTGGGLRVVDGGKSEPTIGKRVELI